MTNSQKRRQAIAALVGALGGAGIGGVGGYLKRYTLGSSSVGDLKRNPYYEKLKAADKRRWMDSAEKEDNEARARLAILGALGGAATGAFAGHNFLRPDSFVEEYAAPWVDKLDRTFA